MTDGAADEPTILHRREGAVSVVTLHRPERLNSFTVAMHGALAATLDAVERDATIRTVVITGAGRGFCAGQDLSDRAVAPGAERRDLGESLEQRYNPLVRRLRALPKPVVMAVNGVAAGAGASLALHGDIVLAARSARFMLAFVKIGLLPDSGATWTLTRLVGEQRAKWLALTGEPLSAEEARQWGLVARVVDDGALMDEAMALATRLAEGPPLALAAIKAAIHAAHQQGLDAQLDRERDEQRRLGLSDDYAEGVAAFLAKRAPRFEGR